MTTYAELAEALYDDSARSAKSLVHALERLSAQPSVETLQAAREAWLTARVSYVQTEVFRFYDGPIDTVEALVNSWPIDESYVDAIIDDASHYPEITGKLMAELNAKQGETSIATGYHVIEFLLWGADQRRDGPGTRAYTSFVPSLDPRAERRSRYLGLAADLLVGHLESVAEAWRDRPGSYRATFVDPKARHSLALILKGMGTLSGAELAGERLTVAYETKNQENEHSCFSDSTDRDLTGNAQGISNVCLGLYRKLDGSEIHGLGMCELVGRYDPALGKQLAQQIAGSVEAMRAIPAPFDTAILGSDEAPSRQAIARAIAVLQQQAQSLAQVAAILQLPAATREAQ